MRLNQIDILIGGASQSFPSCRHLDYVTSFNGDSGLNYSEMLPTLVVERRLTDLRELAYIAAHVVCGLIAENANPVASIPGSEAAASRGGAGLLDPGLKCADMILECRYCTNPFVFSAGEQAFFRERGFEHVPKFCKKCVSKRTGEKVREESEIICCECGTLTTVPFKPHLGRPVYCRYCLKNRQLSPARDPAN